MKYTYETAGTCARNIEFELDDDIVKNVRFEGGCQGNAKGVAALTNGMSKNVVIERLKGIDCGGRGTSCPDQLALALEQIN